MLVVHAYTLIFIGNCIMHVLYKRYTHDFYLNLTLVVLYVVLNNTKNEFGRGQEIYFHIKLLKFAKYVEQEKQNFLLMGSLHLMQILFAGR